MSYDIYLKDKETGKPLHAMGKHDIQGGTYAVGGTTALELNVTYNYAEHFYRTIDEELGIRKIYGMTGEESVPVLMNAIKQLEDTPSDDYWEPTEGNAKIALQNLVCLAALAPEGVWDGD